MTGFNSKIAQELTDIIGHDATLQLIHNHGGKRLYIPQSKTICAEACGLDKTKAGELSDNYARESIDIPLEIPEHTRWLSSKGWSVAKIARYLRRTKRTVRNILRKKSNG